MLKIEFRRERAGRRITSAVGMLAAQDAGSAGAHYDRDSPRTVTFGGSADGACEAVGRQRHLCQAVVAAVEPLEPWRHPDIADASDPADPCLKPHVLEVARQQT